MPGRKVDTMNLYLSGMIGSGKTTLGRLLSDRLEVPMLDLDEEMDRRLGYSFHELVAEHGWVPFRELEYSICKSFAEAKGSVVCLGGGTVRYEWNRDVLRGTGVMVLLEAREDVLIERVSKADRPRVHRDTSLAEDVRRIWREHAETYRRAADIIYRTDEKELPEEIEELLSIARSDPRLSPLFA
ncbi:MAG: shikimate kinase [Alkalispirochaetaceae bacterium]